MSTELLDAPTGVRSGEELNVAALEKYLKAQLPNLHGKLTVEQFPGGHSNLTYCLQLGETQLVLRRPPFGAKIKSAHDMGREYRILARLYTVYPQVPKAWVYCEDESIIGAPFYVMQRVQGLILRKHGLPAGIQWNAPLMQKLSEALVDNLVALHAVDYTAAGLQDLGHPEGYVERQVSGWSKRYFNAKTDELTAVETAAAWLAKNMPPSRGVSLIHNDYKYDNLILDPQDPTRIIAVLDWEMATIADPLMDLGTSLAYWIEAGDPEDIRQLPVGPTAMPGNLTRAEIVARYADKSGRSVEHALFYYVYGLFKVAVIAQQIYARYKSGHSQDPRFGALINMVRVLGAQAVRAIDKGRIDKLGN